MEYLGSLAQEVLHLHRGAHHEAPEAVRVLSRDVIETGEQNDPVLSPRIGDNLPLLTSDITIIETYSSQLPWVYSILYILPSQI